MVIDICFLPKMDLLIFMLRKFFIVLRKYEMVSIVAFIKCVKYLLLIDC